jgi:hypothetical protein
VRAGMLIPIENVSVANNTFRSDSCTQARGA